MASGRRASDRPTPNQSAVAAAVAEYGSERKAAAALGVSRSTLNGVLRGVHGAGAKVTAGISKLPEEKRSSIERTERSLTAARRAGKDLVQAARQRAARERKEPGAAAREAAEHAQRMADQGLNLDGSEIPKADVPPEYDSRGRKLTDQQRIRWRAEQIAAAEGGDVYEIMVRLMLSGGSGGTDVDIEDLVPDDDQEDDDGDDLDDDGE